MSIPKRLKKEPLIEAVWQVHFEPAPDAPVGDLLPGLLFGEMRATQPQLQLLRLPLAELPVQLAEKDPNLRFAAKYRLASPSSSFLVQVGDRIVTLNCLRPYVGWQRFKAETESLIARLEVCGLIPQPTRHSLRYIDLLTLDPPPLISALRLKVTIGDRTITDAPLQLRVEIPDDDMRHVVQIATPAQVQLAGVSEEGTLVDVETIATTTTGGWTDVRNGLDRLHDASKAMFFSQIMTADAVRKMDPEY